MTTLLIVIVVVAVICGIYWVATSSNPLANSLRAMVNSKTKEAADSVDSVQNRVNSALLKQNDLVALARGGTYQVKITLEERQQAVDEWQRKLDQADKDKVLARKSGNRDAFAAACHNYDQAVTNLTSATAARDQIKGLVAQMENQVDAQYDERDEMEERGAQVAAQAVVDDVTAKVNEAKAGLTKADGGKSDMVKAQELASKLHARSTAAVGAAGGLTQREREVNALQALHANVAKTNVDDEWNRVGDKIASPKS
jgi:hypothetical protein